MAPPLIIMAGLAAAGAAVEGFSKFKEASYQAQVARNNFATAKQNAEAASLAAQTNQMRSDREYMALAGEQQANAAASGLDLLGQTQLDIARSTLNRRGEAALDIRRQGEGEVNKYRSDMKNFRVQGKAASLSAFLAVPSSLISGASSVTRVLTPR